jgi:uncharacterized protein YvpB
VLLCWICDKDENQAAQQSEIYCEIKKKKTVTECFQLLKGCMVIMLCHARKFLNGTNDSWKIGKKWKTTNNRDALQHQNPKKMLKKSVKLFGKIDV